jgi:hypothetical protein
VLVAVDLLLSELAERSDPAAVVPRSGRTHGVWSDAGLFAGLVGLALRLGGLIADRSLPLLFAHGSDPARP